jgi:DNA primase
MREFLTQARQVSVWLRVLQAAQAQLASSSGQAVRAYCEGRNLLWREWELGAVVDTAKLLSAAGLSIAAAREGRVLTSPPGEDRWQGRLLGGIYDDEGDVIGLWGRATGGGAEKYLVAGASGPSILGEIAGRRVVVVEGFIDARRVRAVTGETAVAAGGTAVSEAVLDLLTGAEDIVVALDGDAAGDAGRRELTRRLIRWGGPPVSIVAGLGDDEDIDAALSSGGLERWQGLIAGVVPWVTYAARRELAGKVGAEEVAALRRVGALCRAAVERWPVEVAVALREVSKDHALDERFLLKVVGG